MRGEQMIPANVRDGMSLHTAAYGINVLARFEKNNSTPDH